MDHGREEGVASVDASETGTTRSPGMVPTPYGRACASCARAKCRCIYPAGGSDCERCLRLKRECVPSVTVRRRNGRRPQMSRAAQLEEKLEDIVALLRKHNNPLATTVTVNGLTPAPPPPPHAAQAPADDLGVNTPAPSTHSAISNNATQAEGNSPAVAADQNQTPSFLPALGFVNFEHRRGLPAAVEDLPETANATHGIDVDHGPVTTHQALASDHPPTRRSPRVICNGSLLGHVFDPPNANTSGTAPPSPPDPTAVLMSCCYKLTSLEAELNLQKFRTHMLVFMPFVYLPTSMTSDRLRELSPLLWFNIMTITCRKLERQVLMSDAATKYVAHKMLVEGEKTLDLLLGLLAYLCWAYGHREGKPYVSVMASLVKSLVFDLGLNRMVLEPFAPQVRYQFPEGRGLVIPSKDNTLEERRAALAAFCVTSQASDILKRIDSLIWTPHLDESLQILSQQREWDGDDLLVAQVKIQLVLEQLSRSIYQSRISGPPTYYLSALRNQLQTIRAQLPDHLQKHDTIRSQMYYTELCIIQGSLMNLKAPSPFNPDFQRYELFEACLTAITAWFDMHFSIADEFYIGMAFNHWCHMAHCVMMLYRLTLLDDPSWDRHKVKERLDIISVCDELARRFRSCCRTEGDQFFRGIKIIRSMKKGFMAEWAAAESKAGVVNTQAGPQSAERDESSSSAPASGAVVDEVPSADGPLAVPFFSINDSETWLADLLNMNWEP
ncbi:hypothetical protein B0T19DRAFT_482593 [Cercophora scortea]|uniref:Zn(2)-C6 fungal-type domain-containing protein n=1 Tax=Cercophora scortea TaxID=314031 RepID=A0AAE0IVY8_9PEZI|nr:hypothetical protein B0T19DRAFT_482593 [Cercophora scortea]